jgi:hypothetical protein
MKNIDRFYKPAMWSTTVLLATILAACGGGGGGGTAAATPTPAPAATGATCTTTTANCVDLKTAANYVILAEAGVSYTPTATVSSTPKIIGNIGVSPAAASTITGLALNLPAGGAYSTSTLVTGAIYAPGYAPPTPSNLTTAIGDKLAGYSRWRTCGWFTWRCLSQFRSSRKSWWGDTDSRCLQVYRRYFDSNCNRSHLQWRRCLRHPNDANS